MQKDFYTLFCILNKIYQIVLWRIDRCLLKGFWIINIPGYKKSLIQEKEKADNCFKQYKEKKEEEGKKSQLTRAYKQKKRLKTFFCGKRRGRVCVCVCVRVSSLQGSISVSE